MTNESVQFMEAIHNVLFSIAELTAILGTKINYSKAPITAEWPLLHYFDVTKVIGYLMDFNSVTVQFSVWSQDKFEALQLRGILENNLLRLNDTITTNTGMVKITWSVLIDSGALPSVDSFLYGQFLRVNFRYLGNNLED